MVSWQVWCRRSNMMEEVGLCTASPTTQCPCHDLITQHLMVQGTAARQDSAKTCIFVLPPNSTPGYASSCNPLSLSLPLHTNPLQIPCLSHSKSVSSVLSMQGMGWHQGTNPSCPSDWWPSECPRDCSQHPLPGSRDWPEPANRQKAFNTGVKNLISLTLFCNFFFM